MHTFDWKKYLIVFFITVGIFISVFYLSNYLSNKKITYLRDTQDAISMNILASEVQFSLLEHKQCEDVGASVLSGELGDLGSKLSYAEVQFGSTDKRVSDLKSYYSLLQIKDYLLMLSLAEKCETHPIFVLYFYQPTDSCADCVKENYVVDALRQKYPTLRIYSFDYSLDLPAIKTMASIYKVPSQMPVLVINNKVYSGFYSLEQIEKTLPALKNLLPKSLVPTTPSVTNKSTTETPPTGDTEAK